MPTSQSKNREITLLPPGLRSVGVEWERAFPDRCPVDVRDARGVSRGACWRALEGGVCPVHGPLGGGATAAHEAFRRWCRERGLSEEI